MITLNLTLNSDNPQFLHRLNHSKSLSLCPTNQQLQPCSIELVPTWLKLKYPLTKYVKAANAGHWSNITQSQLTTPQRTLTVSLRSRWHALAQQSKNFAELIPDPQILYP